MVPVIVRRKSKTLLVLKNYPFSSAGTRRLISLVVFSFLRTFKKSTKRIKEKRTPHDSARKQKEGGKGGLSFSIFLVSREWFRRERESDRPTVFHFPPRHSSFDSFSSPPIQPFSSHSISSPQPSLPFLCPSVLSAHKGRKKERMGKERMGGSVAKAAAAALLFSSGRESLLLCSPFCLSGLPAPQIK